MSHLKLEALDKMAGSSPIPTLPSGAEGTGSALENTFAPRLRTALKNTKNHPASTTSSLRESSATDTDESVKQDNNDSNMRASRVAIMAAMISSLVSLPQPAKEDYFGPLHYSRVEFSWFLLLAVLALLAFGLACVLTEIAVYLSMCGDACFGWLEVRTVAG